jgi:hypothetical protein
MNPGAPAKLDDRPVQVLDLRFEAISLLDDHMPDWTSTRFRNLIQLSK